MEIHIDDPEQRSELLRRSRAKNIPPEEIVADAIGQYLNIIERCEIGRQELERVHGSGADCYVPEFRLFSGPPLPYRRDN